jgi:hypothetical protein
MELYSASMFTGILTSMIEPLPGVITGLTIYPGSDKSGSIGRDTSGGSVSVSSPGTSGLIVSSPIRGSGINIVSPDVYPIPGLST